jgi:DNA modification methylase
MNDYTIINRDCILAMQEIEDNEIDMVLTSPPYDSLRDYHGIEWNESIWKSAIKELYRIIKPGAVVVWVVADATVKGSETLTSFKQALWAKECGFNIHDTMIWCKDNPVPTQHTRYQNAMEYMFVFSKGKPNTFNKLTEQSKWGGTRHKKHRASGGKGHLNNNEGWYVTNPEKLRSNWWICSVGSSVSGHGATFPEQLAHDHIFTWSNEGDVILDCFAGSGTTLVASLKLNRRAIGIEISTEYCDIIRGRIEKISESEGTV